MLDVQLLYATVLIAMQVTDLAIMPDGSIVSASLDRYTPASTSCRCPPGLSFAVCSVTSCRGAAHYVKLPHEAQATTVCSSLRVWRDNKCVLVLEGHEGAVQCVVCLPSGEIVSGSNDTTIRVWRDGKCIDVLKGHTDTVRQGGPHPNLPVKEDSRNSGCRHPEYRSTPRL